MAPFVIFSLPRSRSAWLSKFLSYKDWHCGHDELIYMRQMEDVQSWLSQPSTGTIETAAASFWRLALHLKPDLRIITVRRDPIEAAESAVKADLSDNLTDTIKFFQYLDGKLDQIELRTKCKSVKYEDLQQESVCKDLFEYVLPYEHDSVRWNKLNQTNIQINVPALKRYMIAHWPQIDRLKSIARQKSLSLLASKPLNDIGGLTLDFESLSEAFKDGTIVMQAHCASVGEHTDNFFNKNLALFKTYEDAGLLQVTVARSNGRIFGYLVSIIGESFEAPGRMSGCHTVFYASPDYPGLGLKLQRKAAEGLRERGVHEVIMRAGVRGSGERVSALYRRIGAEPIGTYYRLEFKEES